MDRTQNRPLHDGIILLLWPESFLFFFSYLNFGNPIVDCKTVGFFLKISKEIGKVWRVLDFPDRVELKENVRVAGFLFPGTKQTVQNNHVSILSGCP